MRSYQVKSLLVTGGAGFIGANFIYYWLMKYPENKIINLDLLTYAGSKSYLKNLSKDANYFFVHGDINDSNLIKKILRKYQINTVVHFAAESHVDRSIYNPLIFAKNNIIGTANLLECVRQYWLNKKGWTEIDCHFHHVSTDEVYGSLMPEDCAFSEISQYSPNSPYAASKASSDHIVRAYYHTYGLPITISHCSNNYGRFQHREKFIPKIILNCFSQTPINIYGNGSNIRDWLHVEDHCSAIAEIILQGKVGETYCIGANNEISNFNLAKKICQIMNKQYPISNNYEYLICFVQDRLGHDKRYSVNTEKIKKTLSWSPKWSFDTGLLDTIFWFWNNIIK